MKLALVMAMINICKTLFILPPCHCTGTNHSEESAFHLPYSDLTLLFQAILRSNSITIRGVHRTDTSGEYKPTERPRSNSGSSANSETNYEPNRG